MLHGIDQGALEAEPPCSIEDIFCELLWDGSNGHDGGGNDCVGVDDDNGKDGGISFARCRHDMFVEPFARTHGAD
uniref:Uncharacterized protein n=1 Tax=Oryza brachyantha TaxID=4533 RepID=J3MRS5_ORYBR